MKKPSLEKHTLRFRPGDIEFLRDRFPRVPVNKTVRRIVSNAVDRLNRPITEEELKELENE